MGIRRKTRELVLQALYQGELLKKPAPEQFSLFAENFQLNQKVVPLAKEFLAALYYRLADIDSTIQTHAENWRLDRMSVVDRNIIRIAVYEMIYCKDIPASVSINEAIEIAKKFSSDDAGPFINGVLDAIRKAQESDPVQQAKKQKKTP